MIPDAGAQETRSVKLYEERGETSRFVAAEIDQNDGLQVIAQDVGKAPREWWGDGDYEFWVHVPRQHLDALLLALIEQQFGGKADAVDLFREFVDRHGIPNEFRSWI